MKITQEVAPFRPVTITFESEEELRTYGAELYIAAKASICSGTGYYTHDTVMVLVEKLQKFLPK